MDWHNDALYNMLPVTVAYAKVLARVVKRMDGLGSTPYQFRFFCSGIAGHLASPAPLTEDAPSPHCPAISPDRKTYDLPSQSISALTCTAKSRASLGPPL